MVAALKDLPRPTWNITEPPLRRIVSLDEFADIAAALPNEKLELINGEVAMTPPPDHFHPDIYATMEIPTYWVVDRRDQNVWVHTQPHNRQYTKREQFRGRRKLPAPGLEFLHVTAAKIFEA